MRIVACLLAIGTTIASDARPNLRRSLSVELPSSPAPVKAKVVNGKCTASFDDLTLEVYANEHNRIATKCLDAETSRSGPEVVTGYYANPSYTCGELVQALHDAERSTDEYYFSDTDPNKDENKDVIRRALWRAFCSTQNA